MRARTQPFHPLAHSLKPHPGQVRSAAAIFQALSGSGEVDPEQRAGIGALQDPYSIRCSPQVLGAARDALTWVEQLVHQELNSVDDNPIVDPESEEILFAGNFYGGHLGLAMDMVKISASTVADLVDRQLALMLASRYNNGLPDTLVGWWVVRTLPASIWSAARRSRGRGLVEFWAEMRCHGVVGCTHPAH